jgi:hypothetical protein
MVLVTQVCALLLLAIAGVTPGAQNQEAAKPTEHVLGTITSVNPEAHTVAVKDDKSGSEILVSTANTRTLIKVLPGAKDLKGATRITATDLAAGDRVDVRGFKDEASPNAIAARSIVLMSARELQAKHQADAAAWQNSTAGLVASVDAATRTISMTSRGPGGPHPITVHVPDSVELIRYSADTPKTPVKSELAEIQPGDQVRVIGTKSDDGASITAERVYSGAFRTIAGTVTAVSPDGKSLTIRDLQTKQPVQIAINDSSGIHKIPPDMATMLARRMSGGGAAAAPAGGAPQSPRPRGDLSQMVQRLPAIPLGELKPGDAVIVSGVLSSDKLQVIASNIIAGVEPMFQSQAGRSRQGGGEGVGGWSLDMAVPTE